MIKDIGFPKNVEERLIDCINHASNGGGIEIDLGLTKDDEIGDVLEGIDGIEYDVGYAVDVAGDKVKVTVRAEEELVLPTGWSYEEIEQVAKEKVNKR